MTSFFPTGVGLSRSGQVEICAHGVGTEVWRVSMFVYRGERNSSICNIAVDGSLENSRLPELLYVKIQEYFNIR